MNATAKTIYDFYTCACGYVGTRTAPVEHCPTCEKRYSTPADADPPGSGETCPHCGEEEYESVCPKCGTTDSDGFGKADTDPRLADFHEGPTSWQEIKAYLRRAD